MQEDNSKKLVLKSTGILGSAQLTIILVGIARVKVLAVLLGPVGVGIAALLQTTVDLLKAATGLGIGYSAVRDIATAASTNDKKRIATTILIMRRWIRITGALGMLLTIIFCRQLSQWAFGNNSYAPEIAILSITLLLTAISSGQLALLQGLQRIGELAKANLLGALLSLVGAVSIYFIFGIKGIVPAILCTYVVTLVISWVYSRKIETIPVQVSYRETFDKGRSMAKLGFFMVITGLASSATLYLVRGFIVQKEGMEAVGHFVAAWSISSLYLSAIFGAMGADFFPRLSAVQHDPVAMKKMVNDQTEIAILLTAPIIIGMVSFVGLVVHTLYSAKFANTAMLLNWQLTGDFFKVLGWPMGYILLAKGKGGLFIAVELFWNLLFSLGVYFGWEYAGLKITGINFLFSYIALVIVVYLIVGKMIRFSWSKKVWIDTLVFLPLLGLSFLNSWYLGGWIHYLVGTLLFSAAGLYSYFHLSKIIGFRSVFNKILEKLKIKRPGIEPNKTG
jgi:O-antigen/teichoic acid export membrane protein